MLCNMNNEHNVMLPGLYCDKRSQNHKERCEISMRNIISNFEAVSTSLKDFKRNSLFSRYRIDYTNNI